MDDEAPKPKKQPTGDYLVGYCKPPRETRWKKGQSGSPNGPRKKAPPANDGDITRHLRKELMAIISPTIGSVRVDMTGLNYIAKLLVTDIMRGTPAQRLKLFKELKDLGVLHAGSAERHQPSAEAIAQFVAELAAEPDNT